MSERAGWLFIKETLTVVRCGRCEHVFLTSTDARAGREKFEAIYHGMQPFNPLTTSRYMELLRKFEGYRSTGRLLDVGYGNGQFLVAARDMGWHAAGTELSEVAHQHARELGLEVFLGDLHEAKFPEESFDVVRMEEVIEHLPDPVDSLKEVRRVLRPGGVLYLTTPNFNSLNQLLLGASWSVFDPGHLHYFTPRSLQLALTRAGFDGYRVLSKNFNPVELFARLPLTSHTSSSRASTGALREAIESRRSLGALKWAVNAALRRIRVGDTLYVIATKA